MCMRVLAFIFIHHVVTTFVNIRSNVALSFPHSTIRIYYYFSCTNFHGHRRRRCIASCMLNVLSVPLWKLLRICLYGYTVYAISIVSRLRSGGMRAKILLSHPWNIGRCDIVGYNRGGSRIGRMLWDIGFRYWRVVSG